MFGRMFMHRSLSCALALPLFAVWSGSGALAQCNNAPPVGPIGYVYKTLDQVEPRKPLSTCDGSVSQNTPSALFSINQPGSYYLTADVVGVTDKNGVEINASDVTLDLMGFNIKTSASGITSGVRVSNTAANVTIQNGHVWGWNADGVHATGDRIRLRDLDISLIGNHAIYATGAWCTVERCEVSRNRGGALNAIELGIAARLLDSSVRLSNSTGVDVASGSFISRCTFSNIMGVGITGDDEVKVDNCSITATTGSNAIQLGNRAMITNTLCANMTHNGIGVGNQSTIRFCTLDGVPEDAVVIAERCTVADCTIARTGTLFKSAVYSASTVGHNAVLRNSITGDGPNGWGVALSGAGNRIDENQIIQCGVALSLPASGNFATRNFMHQNTTNFNVASGNFSWYDTAPNTDHPFTNMTPP